MTRSLGPQVDNGHLDAEEDEVVLDVSLWLLAIVLLAAFALGLLAGMLLS